MGSVAVVVTTLTGSANGKLASKVAFSAPWRS